MHKAAGFLLPEARHKCTYIIIHKCPLFVHSPVHVLTLPLSTFLANKMHKICKCVLCTSQACEHLDSTSVLIGIYTGTGVPLGWAWVNSGSGDEPKCHRRDVNGGWRALRDASELTASGTLIFSRIKRNMSDNVALGPSGKHVRSARHGDERLLSWHFSKKKKIPSPSRFSVFIAENSPRLSLVGQTDSGRNLTKSKSINCIHPSCVIGGQNIYWIVFWKNKMAESDPSHCPLAMSAK